MYPFLMTPGRTENVPPFVHSRPAPSVSRLHDRLIELIDMPIFHVDGDEAADMLKSAVARYEHGAESWNNGRLEMIIEALEVIIEMRERLRTHFEEQGKMDERYTQSAMMHAYASA